MKSRDGEHATLRKLKGEMDIGERWSAYAWFYRTLPRKTRDLPSYRQRGTASSPPEGGHSSTFSQVSSSQYIEPVLNVVVGAV